MIRILDFSTIFKKKDTRTTCGMRGVSSTDQMGLHADTVCPIAHGMLVDAANRTGSLSAASHSDAIPVARTHALSNRGALASTAQEQSARRMIKQAREG